MSNEILLLNENHVKWLADKFDEAFEFDKMLKNKFVGKIIEGVDNKAAQITLNFGNKRCSQYIPDEYKDELHLALNDVMDGDNDYTVAVENVIKVIDELKDKLNVSDFVKALIDSTLELIKAGVLVLLN